MKNLVWVLACIFVCAAPVYAGDHRLLVNPAISLQNFGSERGLDKMTSGVLGLEYRYGEHWGLEVRGLRGEEDDFEVDIDQYFVDAIYYIGVYDDLEPFLALGAGNATFDDAGLETEEQQINFGGGVRFWFTDSIALRAEARAIHGEDDAYDSFIALGVSYAFGAQSDRTTTVDRDRDSDGDGVPDRRDQCPATPAGVEVNYRGCPMDDDGDGVPDYRDDCPNTPQGREVDERGCKLILTRTEEITLNVNFAYDSDFVEARYMGEIKEVAAFLKRYADAPVVIEGHTDSVASDSYNQALSQRRADAVRDVLISRFGIDAARLSAIGYGESRPIADNDTEAGRDENRRVVAVIKAEYEE